MINDSLARIEAAMARIEASVARPRATPAPDADSRYQALRTRTQAALASLESVIQQVGARN